MLSEEIIQKVRDLVALTTADLLKTLTLPSTIGGSQSSSIRAIVLGQLVEELSTACSEISSGNIMYIRDNHPGSKPDPEIIMIESEKGGISFFHPSDIDQ